MPVSGRNALFVATLKTCSGKSYAKGELLTRDHPPKGEIMRTRRQKRLTREEYCGKNQKTTETFDP
jgi:hypothetical protein